MQENNYLLQRQGAEWYAWSLVITLTPKNDQHLISPHNITPESNIKVMRIKEMITN